MLGGSFGRPRILVGFKNIEEQKRGEERRGDERVDKRRRPRRLIVIVIIN